MMMKAFSKNSPHLNCGDFSFSSPHIGFTSSPPMHLPLILGLFMLSTILPQRRQVVPRCLDSWAEPQQVYRLQFRGLAATTAGDGRVMRPYDPG